MLKAIVSVFVILSLFFPSVVMASNYGECGYGEADYGDGCDPTPTATTTSGSSTSSTSSAPSCDKTEPGSAPFLWGATTKGVDSILLQFGAASDPVEHYALEFGVESGKYIWGATTIGDKDTRAYLVESLTLNTTYYFRIRAGNGCATGDWSNEISATTKGYVSYSQLEITDSSLDTIPTTETEISCEEYTVQVGDNLWEIAGEMLGNGSKYKEIIEQNKETYPSLLSSNNLDPGWELQFNCKEESEIGEQPQQESYIVNVNVFGKDQNPIGGATVTIHSDPQEAITDERGMVRFESVDPGEHRVLVAYNGYEGEQSIFLTGDTKEFTLNNTLEMKNILMSRLFIAIVGGMGLVIAALTFFLIRTKFKKP